MRLLRLICAVCLIVPGLLSAQERSKAILVLDGSGSMWGQIDGIAKIAIAQSVVGQLLQTLPDSQVLGLTVYGHRRKGDCADIETLVAPGTQTRARIGQAVNAIKPKGKTPMTDAVRQAAEALRYTEEAATVILVSDGVETCNADPCAAARALEEAGVDFTAHVVGFDISDPLALAQMQCLAAETGGTFRTAANAAELASALTVIAQPVPAPEPKPEPEPEPVRITIIATDGPDGPRIGDDLIWSLRQGESGIVSNQPAPGFHIELLPGEYTVSALRPADEATAELRFGVGDIAKTVVLELPEFRPAAMLDAPATAVAGSSQLVRWTGPGGQRDHITVVRTGDDRSIHYTFTREGPALTLLMPPRPGDYEIRYVMNQGQKVLARSPLTVTAVTAELTAPERLIAGSTVQVGWNGPDYDNDYIALARPGDSGQAAYAFTRNGSPASLKLPAETGDYELRYVMSNGSTVIATLPVEVTDTFASVSPPPEAMAGATIDVPWEGPANQNDYVGITERGGEQHLGYAYTRDGSPARLQTPAEPGEYDVIYALGTGAKVIARAPLKVMAVTASVSPPGALTAGATVKVPWQGPDYPNDYIAVLPKDGDSDLTYEYTRNGSPAALTLPAEPGDYDIAYVMDQGRTVLARVPVTVGGVGATVRAPETALVAGGVARVEWSGPDYRHDYIALFPRSGGRYVKYVYTSNGSPAELELPAQPGEYDIAYVMNQGDVRLASVPVTVGAVEAAVTPPEGPLAAGTEVSVPWQGPDYHGDYIALLPRGGERHTTYAYTRTGNPVRLTLPEEPGEYDLAYVMREGDTVLVRLPVTVGP